MVIQFTGTANRSKPQGHASPKSCFHHDLLGPALAAASAHVPVNLASIVDGLGGRDRVIKEAFDVHACVRETACDECLDQQKSPNRFHRSALGER